MRYLVVNTHTPDTCALRDDDAGKSFVTALRRFRADAPGRGLTIEGWWAYRTGHEMYLVVEAPSVHEVEDALIAAELPQRTTTRVLPVAEIDEVLPAE